MITKEQADYYMMFYHSWLKNADGTAMRCRANGKLKTWKTRPNEWRLPVVHGLKGYFYLTQNNAAEWTVDEPVTKALKEKRELAAINHDRKIDGLTKLK